MSEGPPWCEAGGRGPTTSRGRDFLRGLWDSQEAHHTRSRDLWSTLSRGEACAHGAGVLLGRQKARSTLKNVPVMTVGGEKPRGVSRKPGGQREQALIVWPGKHLGVILAGGTEQACGSWCL